MKKLGIISLFVLILSCSCSEYLKEEATTDLTTDRIYGSEEGLGFAVVGLYNRERDRYDISTSNDQRYVFSIMGGTDLTVYRCCGDEGAATYSSRMGPDNSTAAFNWRSYYEIIERANSILYYSEEVGMSESNYKLITGEARCTRAHAYFHLVRLFDNIYLTTEPTNSLKIEIKPALQEDVFALIIQDLDYAIESLDYTTPQPGRYTRGVARHIRAKVAMWLGDWSEAALQSTTLINEGPYKLLTDLEDIFLPYDLNHKEGIYTYHFNYSEPGDNRKAHRMPVLFMPRYNLKPGVVESLEYGGYPWGRMYPNDYLLSLYDSDDKRLEAYYQRYYTYNDPETLPEDFNIGDTLTPTNPEDYFKHLHVGSKKFWDLTKDVSSRESVKSVMIYRLAETYLISAEALWRDNRETEALPYMNAIRERALGTAGTVTGIDEDLILDERARELGLEGHRWYTLKRMGKLVERVRLYAGDDYHLDARINIHDHHVRRPIPQVEIDMMTDYPQNPGYESVGK